MSAFQRTFTGEIRRLYEMERRIGVLVGAAEEAGVEIGPWEETVKIGPGEGKTGPFTDNLVQYLDDLEGQLVEQEERVLQMGRNAKELEGRLAALVELHDVIAATSDFFAGMAEEEHTLAGMASLGRSRGPSDSSANTTLSLDVEKGHPSNTGDPSSTSVGFVVGVIDGGRMAAFGRVLWRSLRGNVIVRSEGLPTGKSAFVAFVHGQETVGRVRKICLALGCTLYPLDASLDRRQQLYATTTTQLSDIQTILANTRDAHHTTLSRLAPVLALWRLAVGRQKRVYGAMNRFSCEADGAARRCFIAEGWCPTASVPVVEESLKGACTEAGLNMLPVLTLLPTNNGPSHHNNDNNLVIPTHFPTNKFTQAFQDMTDAYGVAAYRESNPAVPMLITFPFLFACMFGDIGHGAIMAAGAAWLIYKERGTMGSSTMGRGNEVVEMAFGGRYVLLLMGLFSIYTGLIYNDCFSKPLPLFPSMFYYPPGKSAAERTSPSYVYPLGLDPKWVAHAENGMTFSNSYKMKQSILLGLLQMTYGLLLALSNHLHHQETLEIFCTWLPQLLFLTCLFGYLGFLIVLKWVTATDTSLLNLFIAMVLQFGAVEGSQLYPGQLYVQRILVIIAVACVPWMLLAKPVYILLQRRRRQSQGYAQGTSAESISSTARKAASEESMGDLMVHQVIHTIEYVLGSVSNTASYLRLWALSLAHAQLSEVLWEMTLAATITSPLLLPIAFALWLLFTLAIMVAMEGMSALLHALRLHWVEFNNKFYRGTGTKFQPFSLHPALILSQPSDP